MSHHGTIKELRRGQSVSLEKIPGGGSLEARRIAGDTVQFYWRYTTAKRTERIPIGPYDSSAPPRALSPTNRGYSVAAALERSRELAKLNQEAPGGLRAERERKAEAERQQHAASQDKQKYSLKGLCEDYFDWLKKQRKPSHNEARRILSTHLIAAFPEVATKPAADVEKREVVAAVRKLAVAGKTATARKLRSYLRAAYATALRAASDASLPSTFIGYGVIMNPVEATAAIRGGRDKNPLSASELRKYWNQLAEEPGVVGAALRLHVLSGGQRPAQLARLRRNDDISGSTLRLLDPKGKRVDAREHLLPVTKEISKELAALAASGYALSTDGGRTPMHPSSLSKWAAEAAARAGIHGFQLKRVRSGIETVLAAAHVDKQTRGQLQSHGIGGVQDAHYDAHTYLPEKQKALKVLYRTLQGRQ